MQVLSHVRQHKARWTSDLRKLYDKKYPQRNGEVTERELKDLCAKAVHLEEPTESDITFAKLVVSHYIFLSH